jgi:hypothetical protein
LTSCARRCGLDPDTNDLSPEEAAVFGELINGRVEEAVEYAWWPELTLCEERFYRADWDDATAYAIGDEVYYATTDAYYVAILAGTNQNPSTATTYWEAVTDMDRYVPWQLAGTTPIAEVKDCYKSSPRTHPDDPYRLLFEMSDNGVQMGTDAGTSVWLEFRTDPPQFTTTAYDAAITYAVGDLVYVASTGECYECIQAGIGQDPTTETAFWMKVDLPYVLKKAIVQGVRADWLRQDGQEDKATAAEAKWEKMLADAADTFVLTQRGGQRSRVTVP